MIFSSVLILVGIGFTAAVVLAVASKVLYVYEAPRIAEVEGALAGANCGGCGYPGCGPAAAAVVRGEADANVCVIGGEEVAKNVAAIMGLDFKTCEKQIAVPDCTGGYRAEETYKYEGIDDCRAQALLYGGNKMCLVGCLGLGTCVKVCPFNAIHMGPYGFPVVNKDACVACGKCVEACPRGVISLHGNTSWITHLHRESDCLAPCYQRCPGRINIPKYINQIAHGDPAGAVLTIKERNPLLLVCGRVCPRPCESQCRRNHVDEPVAINMLKRYASDWEMNNNVRLPIECAPDNGRKIAVVGGGPAGLSCAYFLRRLGYRPTIFESKPMLGGQLRYGIPAYRLPKDVLDWEIDGILQLGVDVRTNVKFGRDMTLKSLEEEGFEATFLGIGAWKNATLRIENEDLPGVMSGTEMLTRVGLGRDPGIGKRVLVIGGGNTAIDCARTAVRYGSDVTLMYRRTENEMPAHQEEIDGAREEGVNYFFLAAPTTVIADESGHAVGVEFVRMELGEPDASGRRRPVPVEGSESCLMSDTVVAAIGQKPELECLYSAEGSCEMEETRWRTLAADRNTLQTNIPNVFTGGDMHTGPDLVISAVGEGRKAARSIHLYLTEGEITVPDDVQNTMLEYTLFEDVENCTIKKRSNMPHLCDEDARKCTFNEIEGALSDDEAHYEAGRCLRCGLTCYDRDVPVEEWTSGEGTKA